MKTGTILGAINRYGAVYVCLAVFFAFCWFLHFAAFLKMEGFSRHFAVMNDRTIRAMGLIDWIAAHSWLAVAYAALVVGSVAFLQISGRPTWTCWATAIIYCVPCAVYCLPCLYISGKLIAP